MHKVYWKLLGKGQDCLNDLYYTLDNIMKTHTTSGLGRKNSASVVTVDAEEKMWNEGILGKDTPKQLSDTILYLLGLNLALRGGKEHCRLHHPGFNSQLSIGKDTDRLYCLIFKEDIKTKMNQGGLDHREIQPCTMYVYKNVNQHRCPVHLFEKYCSLCPKIAKHEEFYLHPIVKPTPWQWYADKPIGINALHSTVKWLAESAGLQGRFSNHSLRASSTTHLFDKGIPEKVIKEISGHCSDCVWEYECTGNNLKCKVSAALGKAPVAEPLVKTPEKVETPLADTADQIAASIDNIVKKMDKGNVKKVSVQIDFQFGDK